MTVVAGRRPDEAASSACSTATARSRRGSGCAWPSARPTCSGRATPRPCPGLDTSGLTGVVEVDPDARTADVQGMCTYEHLVDATLPHGLTPLVVPQLRTITLGGAVTGLGIESTSWRNGLPHESVLEMDVLTGPGEVVTTDAGPRHPDLFRGFPNSYGTLGYATRLRIALEPVAAPSRCATSASTTSASSSTCSARSSPPVPRRRTGRLRRRGGVLPHRVLPRARPAHRRSRPDERLHRRADLLPLDPARRRRPATRPASRRTTTSGAGTPTGSGARARSAPRTRGSAASGPGAGCAAASTGGSSPSTALRCRRPSRGPARPTAARAGRAGRRDPARRTAEFLRWFLREVPIEPVWLCPLRLSPTQPWTLYPLRPGETYVNVGFWSSVPSDPAAGPAATNRRIEREVTALGGHKSLYSESFYDEDEFARLYGGAAYAVLKERWDPRCRLPHLYDKAVRGA